MPTYDYVCDGCGHAFELFQGMTDPVKKTCPKCGKKKLRRLIGAGGAIVFKGSGFYITDYRKGGAPKAGESKGGSEGKAGDAKPAAPAKPAGSACFWWSTVKRMCSD